MAPFKGPVAVEGGMAVYEIWRGMRVAYTLWRERGGACMCNIQDKDDGVVIIWE